MGLPRCKQIRQGTDLVNLSAEHLQAHACNIGRNRAIYIVVKRDGDALRRRPFAHASTCPHQCLWIARLPCANVSVMDFVGRDQMPYFAQRVDLREQLGRGVDGRVAPQTAIREPHHGHAGVERDFDAERKRHADFAVVGNPDVLIEGFEGVQRVVEMDGGLGVFFSGCVIFKFPIKITYELVGRAFMPDLRSRPRIIHRFFQPQPHGFAFDKIGVAFKYAFFADYTVISLLDVAVVLVAGGQGLALACVGKFGVQVFQTAFGHGGVRFALFDELQDAFEVAG